MARRLFFSTSHLHRGLVFGILLGSIAILIGTPTSAQGWVKSGSTHVLSTVYSIPHPGFQDVDAFAPGTNADMSAEAESWWDDDDEPAEASITMGYVWVWQGYGPSSAIQLTFTQNGGGYGDWPWESKANGGGEAGANLNQLIGGQAGDFEAALAVSANAWAGGDHGVGWDHVSVTVS